MKPHQPSLTSILARYLTLASAPAIAGLVMASFPLTAEAATLSNANLPCTPGTDNGCGSSWLTSVGGTLDTPSGNTFTITDCIYTGYAPAGGCSGSPDTSTGLRSGAYDGATSFFHASDGSEWEATLMHDPASEPVYGSWTCISGGCSAPPSGGGEFWGGGTATTSGEEWGTTTPVDNPNLDYFLGVVVFFMTAFFMVYILK